MNQQAARLVPHEDLCPGHQSNMGTILWTLRLKTPSHDPLLGEYLFQEKTKDAVRPWRYSLLTLFLSHIAL